jgi:hypothetical protein
VGATGAIAGICGSGTCNNRRSSASAPSWGGDTFSDDCIIAESTKPTAIDVAVPTPQSAIVD